MRKLNLFRYGLTALMMVFAMTLCFSCGSDDDEETGGNKEPGKTEQYVDLGLSVKWATCNVGASKPEECGDFFAWGETETHYNGNPLSPTGWKSDKYASDWYSFACYKYCDAETEGITKYCVHKSDGYKGFTDGKTVLEMEDDVARVKLGGNWRMPTREEVKELIKECEWEYTTLNGVKGYKVKSKKTGYTDKWIFLPEAGGYDYQEFAKGIGGYWSASLDTEESDWAYSLCFRGTMKGGAGSCRSIGMSVRPVLGSGNTQQESEKEVIPPSKVDGQVNGHDYVELAGIKWATENVGEVGGVECSIWNETYGFYYNWTNAIKAAQSWGNDWALPTKEQWQKLIDECDTTWVSGYSFGGKTMSGYIFSNKKDLSKYIFLPAASTLNDGESNVNSLGVYGNYWSASGTTYGGVTWFSFKNGDRGLYNGADPECGMPVRPVVAGNQEVNPAQKVDGYINKKAYVELAGLKWATENVGDLHVQGVEAVATDATYGYYYNQSNAIKAAASWGGKWKLPTEDQWQKLIDKCNWKWTTLNGKNGYIVSDKNDYSRFIFLPAAGYYEGLNVRFQGNGFYWSAGGGRSLLFSSGSRNVLTGSPGLGMSVRPVAN